MNNFFIYLKNIVRLNGIRSLFSHNHYQIYKEWRRQLLSSKEPLALELPWITVVATNYLKKYFMKNDPKKLKVFEYGSGGSSLFFIKRAMEVVSVEHNKKWFEILESTDINKSVNNWKNYLVLPELKDPEWCQNKKADNSQDYYTAAEDYLQYSFKNYASFIDKYPNEYFDVVLIDGRSRPSCIYHSIKKVKKGGLLVLDNAERERYWKSIDENLKDFQVVLSHYGALVSTKSFTKTSIYIKNN